MSAALGYPPCDTRFDGTIGNASWVEVNILPKNAKESRQTADWFKKGMPRRLKGVRDQNRLAVRVSILEEELNEMQTQMTEDES